MRPPGPLLLALASATALFLIASSTANAAPRPEISVLGEGILEVEAEEGEDTAEVYLTLLNAGDQPARIAVSFEAADSAGATVSQVDPATIDAESADRVKVTFSELEELAEPSEGQLVITGGATPVAQAVGIMPAPQPSAPWAQIIAIGAAFASFLFMAVIVGVMPREALRLLWKRAPGPKWSFDSWATTLTAAGALLGTVLGEATLPDVPDQIDKETIVRLNLLFAVVLVIAPFVFQAIRPPNLNAADQESGLTGFSIVLIFSCSLTFGAVLGELGTLALLSWEVIGGGVWGSVAVGIAGAVAALATYYFLVTTRSLATTDWEAEAAAVAEAPSGDQPATRAAVSAAREAGVPIAIAPATKPERRSWSLP